MRDVIYLDHAASAPLHPQVLAAMTEGALLDGNPSSAHSAGQTLRQAIDRSRDAVAALIGSDPAEVIFTSGATESNNAAIQGIFGAIVGRFPGRTLRILTSPIEHPSTAEPLRSLADRCGAVIDLLPVDKEGLVSADDVRKSLTEDTVLVCVMWVNNIIGSVQPVEEIGRVVAEARTARPKNALPLYLVCDAVQAASWRPMNAAKVGVDALSLSAHKIGGPKGVGALFLKRGLGFRPLIVGGGQEDGRRAGTENAAGIIGLGRAAELTAADRGAEAARLRQIRHTLVSGLGSTFKAARILGADGEKAAPGIVYVQFPKWRGDLLAMRLDAAGIAVSSGSACDAGSRHAPEALRAVYGEKTARHGGIRVSFGRQTKAADIDRLLDVLGRQ
jgi:cysteine desulfurase